MVSKREELLIERSAADDKSLVVGEGHFEYLSDREGDLNARGGEVVVVSKDDIAAVGERFFGERVESAASHDDGMAGGESAEAFEVVGDVPQEVVVLADGAVLCDSDDDRKVVMYR